MGHDSFMGGFDALGASRSAELFGVDAHPGAKLKHAVFFDHASGVVRAPPLTPLDINSEPFRQQLSWLEQEGS